jgi:hypothetical protein
LSQCLLALLLGFVRVGTAVDAPKLNVILFLADDLGWKDLDCYGSDLYQSPNIDKLARDGMKFTQAYSACCVCSPTRAVVMTGKYPARLHITDWIPGQMPENSKLLPGSLLLVCWQIVGWMNPRKTVFDPGVIAWRNARGFVEAANCNIDFLAIRLRQKGQLRATLRTKRTQSPRPFYFTRLSGSETETTPRERRPGHERRAAAATAIQAMTVGDVVRSTLRLIANRTAETTARDDVWVHRQLRFGF